MHKLDNITRISIYVVQLKCNIRCLKSQELDEKFLQILLRYFPQTTKKEGGRYAFKFEW